MSRVFYTVIVALIIFMLINFIPEYMSNHQYYYWFLSDFSNFKVLLAVFACSLLPLGVLFLEKRSLWLSAGLYLLGFLLSSVLFLNIKWWSESLLAQGWFFWLIANFWIVSILAFHFMLSIWWAGDIILKYFFRREMLDWEDYAFSFWAGLIVFLALVYILLLAGLLNPISSFLIFLLWTFAIYKSNIISKAYILANRFSFSNYPSMISKVWVFLALMLIISYLYLGWLYAYIPYPTAWDANHAYMFFPRIWSLNHGIYWDQNVWTPPYMWYSYISYWFSLANVFKINPDTIWVFMNNLSWLYVILFFAALINWVLSLVPMAKQTRVLWVIFWLIGMMAWLSSWMGAFLVFVDNKTDLWVLTLILLALLSWIFLVQKINFENYDRINLYAILSWVFFGFASLAKPTAMIDTMAFAVLLNIMLFGLSWGFWIALGSLWILALSKTMGIDAYLSSAQWIALVIVGWILFLSQFFWKQNIKRFYLFLIWAGSFLATLVIFKLPYIVGYNLINNKTPWATDIVKWVLMWKANTSNNFLAKNNNIWAENIWWLKFAATEINSDLYSWLKPLTWSVFSEDVWRYIGYDNKDFSIKNNIFPGLTTTTSYDTTYGQLCAAFIQGSDVWLPHQYSNWLTALPSGKLKNLFSDFFTSRGFLLDSNYTYSFDPNSSEFSSIKSTCSKIMQWDAQTICDEFNAWKISNTQEFKQLLSQDSQATAAFWALLNSSWFVLASDESYKYSLKDYWKLTNECEYVLKTLDSWKSPYTTYSVPYKWIIPANVSFNWSLQNLSSYYTDIGYIWLIMLVVNIIGLIYSSIKKYKFLSALLLSWIFAWAIWFFIGWWILWYWIGITTWTLLGFVAFLFTLKDDFQKTFEDNLYSRYLSYWLILLALIFIWHQLVLNYSRLATYQPSWPFLWFKTWVWKIQDWYTYSTTSGLRPLSDQEAIKIPYTADDIFQMQFPHYNKLISLVNNRNVDNEWVFLAWTYSRYFFTNQKNVIYDQFLESMWQWFSDNDVSKSWLRLLDKKIKYIAIDPNIWTVVQWAWNSSLFDRFYWTLENKNISQQWALSMIANLVEEGKVKIVYTNNLITKYAYTMPSDFIKANMGSWVNVAQVRANLSIFRYCSIGWTFAKYCSYDNSQLTNLINSYVSQKVQSDDIVQDIADAQWKTLDIWKILQFKDWNIENSNFNNLSYDEKLILLQYLQVRKDPTYFQNILSQSIGWQSQIIVWEVEK